MGKMFVWAGQRDKNRGHESKIYWTKRNRIYGYFKNILHNKKDLSLFLKF